MTDSVIQNLQSRGTKNKLNTATEYNNLVRPYLEYANSVRYSTTSDAEDKTWQKS